MWGPLADAGVSKSLSILDVLLSLRLIPFEKIWAMLNPDPVDLTGAIYKRGLVLESMSRR